MGYADAALAIWGDYKGKTIGPVVNVQIPAEECGRNTTHPAEPSPINPRNLGVHGGQSTYETYETYETEVPRPEPIAPADPIDRFTDPEYLERAVKILIELEDDGIYFEPSDVDDHPAMQRVKALMVSTAEAIRAERQRAARPPAPPAVEHKLSSSSHLRGPRPTAWGTRCWSDPDAPGIAAFGPPPVESRP